VVALLIAGALRYGFGVSSLFNGYVSLGLQVY